MPEPEGQVAAPVEGTTPTPVAPVAVPLADAKGNLRDGWTDSLDEDLRGEACVTSIKTINGAVKTIVNAHRLIGRDKIVRPSELSTEDDWNEFYKAGGRPDTSQGYSDVFVRPEGFPEDKWNADDMKDVMDHYHKLGFSKKQAREDFDYNMGKLTDILKNKVTQDEMDMNALKDGLVSDWGQAYEQKKHLGNLAIQKATEGNDELKERIVAKYGNDPDLIRAFANLGGQFAEDGVVESPNLPTPLDMEQQISAEQIKPSYMDGRHPDHKNQVEKVKRLIEMKVASLKGKA